MLSKSRAFPLMPFLFTFLQLSVMRLPAIAQAIQVSPAAASAGGVAGALATAIAAKSANQTGIMIDIAPNYTGTDMSGFVNGVFYPFNPAPPDATAIIDHRGGQLSQTFIEPRANDFSLSAMPSTCLFRDSLWSKIGMSSVQDCININVSLEQHGIDTAGSGANAWKTGSVLRANVDRYSAGIEEGTTISLNCHGQGDCIGHYAYINPNIVNEDASDEAAKAYASILAEAAPYWGSTPTTGTALSQVTVPQGGPAPGVGRMMVFTDQKYDEVNVSGCTNPRTSNITFTSSCTTDHNLIKQSTAHAYLNVTINPNVGAEDNSCGFLSYTNQTCATGTNATYTVASSGYSLPRHVNVVLAPDSPGAFQVGHYICLAGAYSDVAVLEKVTPVSNGSQDLYFHSFINPQPAEYFQDGPCRSAIAPLNGNTSAGMLATAQTLNGPWLQAWSLVGAIGNKVFTWFNPRGNQNGPQQFYSARDTSIHVTNIGRQNNVVSFQYARQSNTEPNDIATLTPTAPQGGTVVAKLSGCGNALDGLTLGQITRVPTNTTNAADWNNLYQAASSGPDIPSSSCIATISITGWDHFAVYNMAKIVGATALQNGNVYTPEIEPNTIAITSTTNHIYIANGTDFSAANETHLLSTKTPDPVFGSQWIQDMYIGGANEQSNGVTRAVNLGPITNYYPYGGSHPAPIAIDLQGPYSYIMTTDPPIGNNPAIYFRCPLRSDNCTDGISSQYTLLKAEGNPAIGRSLSLQWDAVNTVAQLALGSAGPGGTAMTMGPSGFIFTNTVNLNGITISPTIYGGQSISIPGTGAANLNLGSKNILGYAGSNNYFFNNSNAGDLTIGAYAVGSAILLGNKGGSSNAPIRIYNDTLQLGYNQQTGFDAAGNMTSSGSVDAKVFKVGGAEGVSGTVTAGSTFCVKEGIIIAFSACP
jgi:hypothetical protein